MPPGGHRLAVIGFAGAVFSNDFDAVRGAKTAPAGYRFPGFHLLFRLPPVSRF
jgi:hypothetical protein